MSDIIIRAFPKIWQKSNVSNSFIQKKYLFLTFGFTQIFFHLHKWSTDHSLLVFLGGCWWPKQKTRELLAGDRGEKRADSDTDLMIHPYNTEAEAPMHHSRLTCRRRHRPSTGGCCCSRWWVRWASPAGRDGSWWCWCRPWRHWQCRRSDGNCAASQSKISGWNGKTTIDVLAKRELSAYWRAHSPLW